MAVLLHAYLNIKDLSAIVNIAWGRVVLPVRLTVTGSGVVVTTPKSCKIVSPNGKSRTEEMTNIAEAVKGCMEISSTEILLGIYGYFGNSTEYILKLLSTFIVFDLIYNTRYGFLGKRSLDISFIEGNPNLTADIRLSVKLRFAGIMRFLFKILFGR